MEDREFDFSPLPFHHFIKHSSSGIRNAVHETSSGGIQGWEIVPV
jgi:hypothetical protein